MPYLNNKTTNNRSISSKTYQMPSGTLRIIPLGGLGEVTRNMTVFEFKDDILIVDIGLRFPEEDMPGIDYIIPNVKYLEDKKNKIRGVIFTHGHYDHIGAVPYVIDKLGYPPMYATALTRAIILKRQEDFPHQPSLDITEVKAGDRIKIGDYFDVEFIHINHNIPQSVALAIRTPVGLIFHTGDWKFDSNPLNEPPADIKRIKELGKEGILLLMCDALGAERDGHSISEKTVSENLAKIFEDSKGMIIAGTFASLINRVQQLVELSEKSSRKVVFDGYSMRTNALIAKELGFLTLKRGTEIGLPNIDDYPRSNITAIVTGAQGEGRAVFMRIANGEHKYIKILKGDSIIFSSSVIPGNERTVQFLKDKLYRTGAKIYHYQMMDIHAGGHAQREDLKEMLSYTKPKFLMPISAHYSMMVNLSWLAQEQNVPEENIIIADNGDVINIEKNRWYFDEIKVPADFVYVDGSGVGDVGNVVLRDRQVLAQDGIFVIVTTVDSRTGLVRTSPDIISRGFIYLRENAELLNEVRRLTRRIVERKTVGRGPINWAYLKDEIKTKISEFLFQKTQRKPMVMPVVIEV